MFDSARTERLFLLPRKLPSSDGEAALTGGPVSDGGREEPFLRRNALTEGEAFLPRPPPQAACAPVPPAGGGVRRGALSVWKKTYRGSCKKCFALPKAAIGISPRRGSAANGRGRARVHAPKAHAPWSSRRRQPAGKGRLRKPVVPKRREPTRDPRRPQPVGKGRGFLTSFGMTACNKNTT